MKQLSVLIFLLVSGIFAYCAKGLFLRENFKSSSIYFIENDQIKQGIDSSKKWVETYRKDEWAHYYYAWFCMKDFLQNGDVKSLEQSEKSFELAQSLYGGDPIFYLRHSELKFLQARFLHDSKKNVTGINLLKTAASKDPNHYYYYSLMFEKLMEINPTRVYGSKRNKEYVSNVQYALKNYLRLKSFYKDRYIKMLKSKIGAMASYKILKEIDKVTQS